MPDTTFNNKNLTGNSIYKTDYAAETAASYQQCVHSFKAAMDAYQNHYNIVVGNGLSPDSRIKKMQAFHEEMHAMYQELRDQGRDFGYDKAEKDADKAAARQLLKSVSGLF